VFFFRTWEALNHFPGDISPVIRLVLEPVYTKQGLYGYFIHYHLNEYNSFNDGSKEFVIIRKAPSSTQSQL